MFGIYETRSVSHYDDEGGGGSSHTTLLATGKTKAGLVKRWNSKVNADRAKFMAALDTREKVSWVSEENFKIGIERDRKNYRDLPTFKKVDDRLRYLGSTSGGYASVIYYVGIKPIKQWDEVK